MAVLLERVARTKDGARLAEALVWVLSQPQPGARPRGARRSSAARSLALDVERAVLVARRALDAFGARLPALRDAIVAAARRRGVHDALAVMALERAVAVEDKRTRGPLSPRSARRTSGCPTRRVKRGRSSLSPNSPDEATLASVEALCLLPLSADGELARAEALALVLAESQTAPSRSDAALAWRRLGGARWDLAGDRAGAEHALWEAAKLDAQRGFTTFAFNLAQFGGPAYALDTVEQRIRKEPSDVRAALMAAQTSRVALALGEPSRGFDFAVTALARNPKLSEALEVAESAAGRRRGARSSSRARTTT